MSILLVFVTALALRVLPFANGGMFNVALFFVTKSLVLNPLSAITSPWGANLSSNPEFYVIFLSDIPPDHSVETNMKAPDGEIPTKSLKVLWVSLIITPSNFLGRGLSRLHNEELCAVCYDTCSWILAKTFGQALPNLNLWGPYYKNFLKHMIWKIDPSGKRLGNWALRNGKYVS